MSILYKNGDGNIVSLIPDMNNIDDTTVSASTTYSSSKIEQINAEYPIASTTTGINPTITDSADGLIQDVTVYGRSRVSKNLLDAQTVTVNNITFTVDSDKYIIASPANSDPRIWEYSNAQWKFTLPAGEYAVVCYNAVLSTDSNSSIYVITNSGAQISKIFNLNAATKSDYFTLSGSTDIGVMAKIYDAKCRIMICKKSDYDTDPSFEPYFSGIHGIGEDGELEITTANSDNTASSTAAVTTGIPLCGIPVTTGETYTDEQGQKWLADTADVEGVTKRVNKVTLDGSEAWGGSGITTDDSASFYTVVSPAAPNWAMDTIPIMISNNLDVVTGYQRYNGTSTNCISLTAGANLGIRISGIKESADLKTYLASNPITVIYELATPTTQELTPTEKSALLSLKTYDSTTNITATDDPTSTVGYLLDTDNGQAVAELENRIKSEIDDIKNENERSHFCYSYKIDMSDSNPATCVKPHFDPRYGCDNFNFTSAHMDYANDKFDYGSWEGFIRRIARPCMLKYDGTVDYYLDPDDYSKKITGEASDVADVNYQGNAMVELEKLYFKRYTYNGIQYCFIADRKLDKSFKCYAHHDKYGRELDYIYRACYDGMYDGTRLRSISGVDYHNLDTLTAGYIMSNATRQEEMDFAKANNVSTERGEGWNILHKSEWDYINDILVLISMSTDTQTTFGRGRDSGYVSTTNTGIISTGTMDTKGLFWGENNGSAGVKVLGIENPWANIWKSCAGWMLISNQHYTKMTFGTEDGSTGTGFNTDGTGYLATGASISANGYISDWAENDNGFLPTTASGSASTYRCDYVWQNTTTYFALVGGASADGLRCGAFYSHLNDGAGHRAWRIGAALSYKPLAGGELAA